MYAQVGIKQYRENKDGTDLMISVSGMKLGDMLRRKKIQNAEIRFDDGRHISAEQRKKAYATIRDIADWTGYLPEEMKELLKYEHISSTFLAFVIALAIGIACGFLVGLVISRADVPPIIATMGFMYIYRAMGYLVSHNGEWASAAALGKFKDFATTKFLGMSLVIWVIIFCYAVFFVFMKWTTLGRRIYAVGSNPSAAEVSGINVKNIKLLVYTIMGLLAGLGGALQVSIYASAMPDMQQGGEMDVIAACVIGGVSMSGGRGTVLGALLGSLILATIAKALPLIPFFDQLWLNTIKGVIILVVVVVNIVLQRTADKNALKGREM